MSHSREPIPHTCPDIDKYIKIIKREIISDRFLRDMDNAELLKTASDMSSTLKDCIDYLEELRTSNGELRTWGISESERADIAEVQLNELLYKEEKP